MIYQRHIIRNIGKYLAVVLLIIVGLVWLNQIMRLAYLVERGVELTSFIKLSFLAIPTLTHSVLPLIFSLAAVVNYNNMNNERELIAFNVAAISNFRIFVPVLKLAILVTCCALILSCYLAPVSYHNLREKLHYLQANFVKSLVYSKSFNQIAKDVILYVDKKENNSNFLGIMLFDNRGAQQSTIFAPRGKLRIINGVPTFELYNGIRQVMDNYGALNQVDFGSLRIQIENTAGSRTVDNRNLNEYHLSELLYPDKKLSYKRQTELKVTGHARIVWPCYNIALVALVSGMFLNAPHLRVESRKNILKIFLAVLAVIYGHFTCYRLAMEYEGYIYLLYANLLGTFLVGLWLLLGQKNIFFRY